MIHLYRIRVCCWSAILAIVLSSLAHLTGIAQINNAQTESNVSSDIHGPLMEDSIRNWFAEYDGIRRRAKMTLWEKFQSRHLLALSFDPMMLFRSEATPMLEKMISKYAVAVTQLERLQRVPETEELHAGYLRYFKEARKLFMDICEAQKEELSKRGNTLENLMLRKKKLESLDQANKQLDARLRKQYHIAPLRG
jgi:hypothetical protein